MNQCFISMAAYSYSQIGINDYTHVNSVILRLRHGRRRIDSHIDDALVIVLPGTCKALSQRKPACVHYSDTRNGPGHDTADGFEQLTVQRAMIGYVVDGW